MLTYKVQSILEQPLKPLNTYIINTKLIVIWFMLSRHIQLMLTRHIQFMLARHIQFMFNRHIWFMLTRHIQFMLTRHIWCMLTRYIGFMPNMTFFVGLWSQLALKLTIHSIPCSWIL